MRILIIISNLKKQKKRLEIYVTNNNMKCQGSNNLNVIVMFQNISTVLSHLKV